MDKLADKLPELGEHDDVHEHADGDGVMEKDPSSSMAQTMETALRKRRCIMTPAPGGLLRLTCWTGGLDITLLATSSVCRVVDRLRNEENAQHTTDHVGQLAHSDAAREEGLSAQLLDRSAPHLMSQRCDLLARSMNLSLGGPLFLTCSMALPKSRRCRQCQPICHLRPSRSGG